MTIYGGLRRNGQTYQHEYENNPDPESLPRSIEEPYLPILSKLKPDLCMESESYYTNPIRLYPCPSDWYPEWQEKYKSSRFHLDMDGRLRSFLNPLECIITNNAGDIFYYPCHCVDSNNCDFQRWRFLSDGRIMNVKHQKYITVENCGGASAVIQNAKLVLKDCGLCQEWFRWN